MSPLAAQRPYHPLPRYHRRAMFGQIYLDYCGWRLSRGFVTLSHPLSAPRDRGARPCAAPAVSRLTSPRPNSSQLLPRGHFRRLQERYLALRTPSPWAPLCLRIKSLSLPWKLEPRSVRNLRPSLWAVAEGFVTFDVIPVWSKYSNREKVLVKGDFSLPVKRPPTEAPISHDSSP